MNNAEKTFKVYQLLKFGDKFEKERAKYAEMSPHEKQRLENKRVRNLKIWNKKRMQLHKLLAAQDYINDFSLLSEQQQQEFKKIMEEHTD